MLSDGVVCGIYGDVLKDSAPLLPAAGNRTTSAPCVVVVLGGASDGEKTPQTFDANEDYLPALAPYPDKLKYV
eukprot:5565693-Pyramimonas_sp.AAC.1